MGRSSPSCEQGVRGDQDALQKEDESARRGEDTQMPSRGQRISAGERTSFQETLSPTPAAVRARMVHATAAVEDRELRHVDVEQARVRAVVDEEIYIELPEEYQASLERWASSTRQSTVLFEPAVAGT